MTTARNTLRTTSVFRLRSLTNKNYLFGSFKITSIRLYTLLHNPLRYTGYTVCTTWLRLFLQKIAWWQRHTTPWERRLFLDYVHWQITSTFQTNQNTYEMICDSKINLYRCIIYPTSAYVFLSGVHTVQKKLDLLHAYYYEFSMSTTVFPPINKEDWKVHENIWRLRWIVHYIYIYEHFFNSKTYAEVG
jgi:hypothetical protein